MSEQILDRTMTGGPMPAGAMAAPGGPVAADADTGGGKRRTLVIVLLAVVGGLLVGGLVLFMFGRSPADEAAFAPIVRGNPGAAAAAEAQAGDEAAAEAVPVQASTRLTSRDPFAPLVPKKAPPPAKAPEVAPAPAAGAPAAGATAAAPTPATGGTISALNVSPLGDSVTLKLDGKKYTVEEGETFAKSYRLYDIFNNNCAGFLYGDRNAVVCTGDSVTVG
jgi:hypothetical protein